jgi:hypothetical protein
MNSPPPKRRSALAEGDHAPSCSGRSGIRGRADCSQGTTVTISGTIAYRHGRPLARPHGHRARRVQSEPAHESSQNPGHAAEQSMQDRVEQMPAAVMGYKPDGPRDHFVWQLTTPSHPNYG